VTIHLDEMDEQVTLPEQPDLGLAGAAAVEGERRLVLAVFEDALQTFRKYAAAADARGRTLFREAEAWFMEGDAGAALSFEYASETLGLDVELVRAALRRWRDRSRPRPRSGSVAVVSSRADDAPWRLKKASGE
jgi:hypothetical protein